MRDDKIRYLDGLRGVAALVVLFTHFAGAFYPALLFNDPSRSHIRGALETWVARTPASLLVAGELAVCVFFVLSGYVLSVGFWEKPDRRVVASNFLKRYLRLEIPILASVLFSWLLLALGLSSNLPVNALTKSDWLALYFRFEPSLAHALREAVFDVLVSGGNDYNPVLWTMRVELLGSYLVYALLILFGTGRLRLVAYPAAAALSIRSYYVLFVVGMMLSAMRDWTESVRVRRFVQELGWGLLVAAVLLGTYPYYHNAKGTWWQYLGTFYPILPRSYPRLAAPLIVGAVLLLPSLQRFLSSAVPRFLGRVSFSLYLVHFPILATGSCLLFLGLHPYAPYNVCGAITFVFTLGLVLPASVVMTRYVDGPAIRLSRLAGAALVGRGGLTLPRSVFR